MSPTSREPYSKSIKIIFQAQIRKNAVCQDEIKKKIW
jgi:hypothetical protein